jgi:hypothetical protein
MEMKQASLSIALTIALVFTQPALAGRTEPIKNPSNIPVAWNKARQPTLDEIGRAIVTGCSVADWQCGVAKPGQVRAVLYVGRHMAECLIEFDTSNFSITYVNSSTLLYDAKKNKIHRNYNLWVADLINKINAAISAIPE